ncbi:MAG: hypothetical protein N0E48_22250, partial [Candidatus Thiodiazotropha endolucinida]|nr:hypothetical protein [Candidatus Thiodiazotropha taylori]MCW4346057.1 hypothetical protein [Candidatus Thiodiazotropha endolucinida]
MEHSVVAIEPGEDEEEDESTQPYSYSEESTDTDEPEAKRMRVTASGDGESSKQEPVVNFIEVKQASNDYLPNGPKGIPYCEDDVKGINKTLSQVLAQTITNAFLQVKLHPYLINQFIPSFLANNKYVTIHMYNPNEDILLTQGQAMPIISSNKLNNDTVLSIWLALNMFQFLKARKNPPEFEGLSKELKQKKCNFQKLIRGDKLNIYFDELHIKYEKNQSLQRKTDLL